MRKLASRLQREKVKKKAMVMSSERRNTLCILLVAISLSVLHGDCFCVELTLI